MIKRINESKTLTKDISCNVNVIACDKIVEAAKTASAKMSQQKLLQQALTKKGNDFLYFTHFFVNYYNY